MKFYIIRTCTIHPGIILWWSSLDPGESFLVNISDYAREYVSEHDAKICYNIMSKYGASHHETIIINDNEADILKIMAT